MIKSAEEFKKLRESESEEEYFRAANDASSVEVWMKILLKFPDLAFWVAHNKTIPLEILYILAEHEDEDIREIVARKRKIDLRIFEILRNDLSQSVRYALLCNTKLANNLKCLVNTEDSDWLKEKLEELNCG